MAKYANIVDNLSLTQSKLNDQIQSTVKEQQTTQQMDINDAKPRFCAIS